MVKKVEMYESDDGKLYKTKRGAKNRNEKWLPNRILAKHDITFEEQTDKIKELAKVNWLTKQLLEEQPDWRKWEERFLEELLDGGIFESLKKTTHYYLVTEGLFEDNKEEIAVEIEDEFTDDKMHIGDYDFISATSLKANKREVYYRADSDPMGELINRLEKGKKLNENEVELLLNSFDEVHKEVGENRRWSRGITSVVDVRGKLYAIDWDEALTESQINSYDIQPTFVKLEEKEVVTTVTTIVEIEKEEGEDTDEK